MLLKCCKTCNKNFEIKPYRNSVANFCSRLCYVHWQRNNKNIDHICKHCGIHFKDSPCKKRIYCSRNCVNKSEKAIFKPKYSTVRKMMLKRDMIKKCEICSYDEVPAILGIHHKDGDRSNNDISNLMVVCPNCHSLIHHKHISH